MTTAMEGGSNAIKARSVTIEEDDEDVARPLPYMRRTSASVRRPSSAWTDSTRRSLGAGMSTDSLLLPRATSHHVDHEEPSWWHSAPLLFAIVPAIAGVVFQRGSVFITDLALLVLAALYLNWCLVSPWVWYRSAQSIKLATPPADDDLGGLRTAVEDLANEVEPIPQKNEWNDDEAERETSSATPLPTRNDSHTSEVARRELRLHEVTALALCFLGPLIGSYILHIIRLQLSTIGDQLVSNLHLSLFVLGAEIRPLRHALKMAEARTIYLQRVVREDPHATPRDQDQALDDTRQRLDEIEASLANKFTDLDRFSSSTKTVDSTENLKKMQTAVQSQIDALNRAVRRYEKRATAQTMQTEANLKALEVAMKEAVSLAAAAATYSQRPGTMATTVEWTMAILILPFKIAYAAVIYPIQLAGDSVIGFALAVGIVQRQPHKQSSAKQAIRSRNGQTGYGRKVQKRNE